MATYKVLQDIEADDKLLGPLSLKQFIFAAMTIGILVVMFFTATSPAPTFLKGTVILVLLFPLLLTGFLAAPISRDQPNEVWLLARINFMFRSRRRIWNQDGVKELVTITAPKKLVHIYTNSLSQTEVRSRLQALANTVDSRGWAVKNVNTNLYAQADPYGADLASDRLVNPQNLPQDVPMTDITASDDILDIANNSTAAHLEELVQKSSASQRQHALQNMKPDPAAQATPQDYWFMNQTTPTPQMPLPEDFSLFQSSQVVAPGTQDVHPAAEATNEEQELVKKIASEKKKVQSHANDHVKTLQPIHNPDGSLVSEDKPKPKLNDVDPFATLTSANDVPSAPPTTQSEATANPVLKAMPDNSVVPKTNPAILGLARNDDLNIATIARQAKRIDENDGEVVISLH